MLVNRLVNCTLMVGASCQNGGSCIDGINSYGCACVEGYNGTVKQILMNTLLILAKMVQLVQMESILTVACVLLVIAVPTVKQILINTA